MLKFTVDSLDTVPEAVRSMYAEKDGKFHLQVDGAVPKDRLDEFRGNNHALRDQIKELTAKYEGVDLDAYRTLTERAQKERDKKLIDAGKVDELVQQRVDAMRADHDKAVAALTGERDAATKQLEGLLVDGALRDAATKAGVRATAIDDVLLRGQRVFRVAEGKATAFAGDKPQYGKDGEPLSVAEWVGSLTESAPHLFEPSKGGGAPAGGSKPGGGKPTIKRAEWMALAPAEKAVAAREKAIVD